MDICAILVDHMLVLQCLNCWVSASHKRHLPILKFRLTVLRPEKRHLSDTVVLKMKFKKNYYNTFTAVSMYANEYKCWNADSTELFLYQSRKQEKNNKFKESLLLFKKKMAISTSMWYQQIGGKIQHINLIFHVKVPV